MVLLCGCLIMICLVSLLLVVEGLNLVLVCEVFINDEVENGEVKFIFLVVINVCLSDVFLIII